MDIPHEERGVNGPGRDDTRAEPTRQDPGSAGPEQSMRLEQERDGGRITGHGAALKFVGRVALLDFDAVRAVIETWRDTMRRSAGEWFAAEETVAHAILASGRRTEQRGLLMHAAEAFEFGLWYGGRAHAGVLPEHRVGATEASGQYLATTAMLALLVRDAVDPRAFEILYDPFSAVIPLTELARE